VGIDTLSSSRGYRHGRSARYHIAKDKPSQPGRKNDMALQDINPTTKTALGDMDEAAQFEVGLRQHMSFLRSFARALSGNRELAEDLAQGALTKAWQCRDSFTVGTNLKAWLCTILRNEFIPTGGGLGGRFLGIPNLSRGLLRRPENINGRPNSPMRFARCMNSPTHNAKP
jgi:hypothetical protein